jgi:F0F1-type ATP synthase beta subunit
MNMKKGKITKIVGPVVDVDFGEETTLPPIYNALKVKTKDREIIF